MFQHLTIHHVDCVAVKTASFRGLLKLWDLMGPDGTPFQVLAFDTIASIGSRDWVTSVTWSRF